MMSSKIKSVIEIVLIVGAFLLASYFVQNNSEFFYKYFDIGISGMVMFVILMIASIVIAPVSSMPVLPLASMVWGWKLAGILSIIGWTIGAVIAFTLARKYGVKLVGKVLPMEKIKKFEMKIPDENLFLTVVFLRMVIPVDGLSYLLGLFSRMGLGSYTLATIIGITPFAFVFAYLGTMPLKYQISFMAVGSLIFIIGMIIAYYKNKFKK